MWKILIAEDNPSDRKLLVDGLKDLADITLANDGNEAIDLYNQSQKENEPFDFILLDVDMPEPNGFEVLKRIRAQEESQPDRGESHIFMTTTHKDSLMENYNMGWDEFFTKPVDVGILIKHMKSIASSQNTSIT